MSTPITMLHLGHLFNLVGGSLMLATSIMLGRRHPTTFFRAWMGAFGFFLLMLACECVGTLLGRSLALNLFEPALVGVDCWCFWTTARLLRGGPMPGRLAGMGIGGLAVATAAALLMGAPFGLAGLPLVLALTVAMVRFGLVFLRELPPADVAPGARWVGLSAIALALWPFVFPYPLVINTPYAWIGFAVSGVLGSSLGLAMALYMVEVSWQRYRLAQEQLAQVKNDFVSVVSHELRSPLTAAIGYAEFLDEELAGPLNEAQREYVEEIQKGHRRLRRLVDDLLDFSLAESRALKLARRDTELAPLVHAAVESHRPQAQRAGVKLEAECPDGLVCASVDPERLEQVVTNLLGNALKFTPEGGRVRVALRSSADQALLEVHDTGMGIDPADLPHLFDKFFQAGAGPRRVRGGAGLGLAVAKAIVEAHDGTIRVDSRPGEGTRFMIALPLSAAAGAPLEPACAPRRSRFLTIA